MLHIIVSGIDKSGKTTLIKNFMEETNYEHYIVDRGPNDYHFFNIIRNRLRDLVQLERYYSFQKEFSKSVDLAIFLKVEKKDWLDRCERHREPPLVGDMSMKKHQEELERFFDSAKYKNVLKINTSQFKINECVKLIERKIKCL